MALSTRVKIALIGVGAAGILGGGGIAGVAFADPGGDTQLEIVEPAGPAANTQPGYGTVADEDCPYKDGGSQGSQNNTDPAAES